jgi:hypothetical protein
MQNVLGILAGVNWKNLTKRKKKKEEENEKNIVNNCTRQQNKYKTKDHKTIERGVYTNKQSPFFVQKKTKKKPGY